jgi:hypothetical protein
MIKKEITIRCLQSDCRLIYCNLSDLEIKDHYWINAEGSYKFFT